MSYMTDSLSFVGEFYKFITRIISPISSNQNIYRLLQQSGYALFVGGRA